MLYPDPAAEARARIGRRDNHGHTLPPGVLEDAGRQVTAMLTGLNDLAEALPVLAEPLRGITAGSHAQPKHDAPLMAGAPNAVRESAAQHSIPSPGDQPLHALPLAAVADLIRRREVSPVEVTRAVLDRIEVHDGLLRTFIVVTAEQALDDARRAETEIGAGMYRGPLHGVPLAAKDLYDQQGVPTTAGSSILRDYVPSGDSAAVAAWRAAGAVLLGKNTMHEFAFGGTSVNEHTGTPRNPWNPEHMCGGSSGGSAAAVAAGFAYGALGSETGNSVRRPAAFCGVVGLKPTYGRCSRRGVFPLAWSLDHVGVFGRTPADVALLANPLGRFDAEDPGSRRALASHAGAEWATPLSREALRGRRVGVPRALVTGIDPEVIAAFEDALGALRAAGVDVRDVALPLASRWTALVSSITMQSEAASVHARWLRERPLDYGADVLGRLVAGQALTAPDYIRAQEVRGAIRDELLAALHDVDTIVGPGTPAPAPLLQGGALVAGDAPFSTTVSAFHLQRLSSLTGLPAVSVPTDVHSGGLPMAIQLTARPWEEGLALGLAALVIK